MGVMLRQTATNTFYHARLSANGNNLVIAKVVTGTNTDLFTTAFTTSTATFYWIRFRIVGTNLYAKAWADGSGEPGSWTLTGTDSSIAGAGNFGLTINATSTAVTWDFDTFSVTDATTTMVFPMRAVIATQVTKVFKLRAPVRTQATKVFKLRAMLTNNTVTKIFKSRLVLMTQNTKVFKLRAFIVGQNTRIFKLRSIIKTQNTKVFKLRLVSSISATKIFKVRAKIRTQSTKTFQLRLYCLDPPILSGGFTLFANGTGTASFDHFRVTQYPDPALNLAPVLDRLATSMSWWTANTPTSTTLSVKTSLDGVNWSTATNGSAITGITGQQDPTIDTFTIDSSANYTSTNKTGGSTATVVYDTTNRRITLSGGSGALYLNSSISAADIDLLCDMDRSDAGGLVWRFVDASNYYELGAYDDSASGGFTNALRLYKVSSGTRSLLGSASVIAWPRSTANTSPYRRTRVTMLAGIITVSIDGVLMQTYTDGSPLGAGKCGLRNDGGTSRYYQLRIQPRGDYVSGTPAGDVVTSDFVYTQATLTTTDPAAMPQLLNLTTSARSPAVASGALIPQFHDPSKPFAAMLNKELDTLSAASGDFTWNVSKAGALSFLERHATPAPFCLHSSDLQFVPVPAPVASADLYRNRMKIINCIDITSTQNETKVADGSASSWQMAYPLYSAPTITINGVARTVGVQGVDTGKDFYWQAGSNAIGQDSAAVKIPAGTAILFSYIGQFPTTVTRDNLAEQTARAAVETGTSGIIEWIEDGKGMLASNATVYADGLLARYGKNDAIQLTATTLRNNPVIESGMMVPVFIPEHSISNHQMLCTNVTVRPQQQADTGVLYTYTLTLTEGANLQNWTKVFGL